MENRPQQATFTSNREMERRLKGLYKRGDTGAMHWMVRALASSTPPDYCPAPNCLVQSVVAG